MNASKPAALIAVTALVVGGAMPAASQQPPGTPPSTTQSPPHPESQPKPATSSVPVYKPPLRGAPGGRIGGGTRGAPRDMFVLSVLAPDHSGLTVQEQPPLYWFISSPTSVAVELTVTDPSASRPLVERRLPSPVSAGLHTIRLTDYGVRLVPGVQYRWFVAVVADPARRSHDILAGGTVERIDEPDALRARLSQARTEDLPFIYAEAGLWYDALAAVSGLIDRAPDNPEYRRQRAALLAQVGLPPIDDEHSRIR